MNTINITFCFISLTICVSLSNAADGDNQPVPSSCQQLIVVLTESDSLSTGTLYCFKRERESAAWLPTIGKTPITIGRNGLGWGRGLHTLPKPQELKNKKEGDGKSPAGVFRLSHVFGYAPAEEMAALKMPYIHLTELIECVDDAKSEHYNRIVSRDDVESVDWRSSEKMSRYGVSYALGVVVDHNTANTASGAGSCIFLHNWTHPADKTSGCTAMAPEKMKEIAYWLDKSLDPVLVQLPKQVYADVKEKWSLPKISIVEKE